MDDAKEKALLGWLGCLLDSDDGAASLTHLDYGTCFLTVIMYMDSSTSLEDHPNTKDRVLATKKFLEDFYNTSFPDGGLVDFNVLSEAAPNAEKKEEIAKGLLLLLCAGIQVKNPAILAAAMRVDAALHWDVRQLIEAVVRPDEPTTSLPPDFPTVLLQRSDPGPSDRASFFSRLVSENTPTSSSSSSTSSAVISATASARPDLLSEMLDSPLRLRISSLSLSGLNDSGQITSPQRAVDSDLPFTPLEELVNSPQLARKIMQREKEYRSKLERQVREREESLRRCQQDLRTGQHLRDELELDLQESNSQLHRKDVRIGELEEQVQRLRAVQDRLNQLGAMQDCELERDVESLRGVAQTAETMKQCCQSLKEENSSLYQDLSTLRDKVSRLEACECEAGKARQQSERLRGRVVELEGEGERWREAWSKAQEERRAMETDMDVLRKILQQQRQQILDRSGSDGDMSGESMGVVTDKLVEELRAELDHMRATWIPPDLQFDTQRRLEASQAALAHLEGERGSLSDTVQQLKEELHTAQTQETQATDRCTHLQMQVDQRCAALDCLQSTVDDLHSEQMTWFTQGHDLRCRLDEKREECEGLLVSLEHSGQHGHQLQTSLDDLQAQCHRLTSDLSRAEQRLCATQADMEEKDKQRDQLASDLQSKTSELAQLASDLQSKTSEQAQLASDLQSKTSEMAQLVAEKSQAVAESESSTEREERAMMLNEELQQTLAERDAECHSLKRSLEQKETECKTLPSDLDQQMGDIEEKESKSRTLQCDLDERVASYARLEQLLETKEGECAELQKAVSSKVSALQLVSKELEEKQSALTETQRAAEERETQCQSLQQMLDEQSAEITQLNKRCEELDVRLQEQREKVTSTERQLTSGHQHSEEELDRLRSQADDQVRSLTADRDRQVQALTCQLQEKETHLTGLTSDLLSKDAALCGVRESQQQLQALNHSLEEQLSQKQAALDELERVTLALKDDLTTLTSQLTEDRRCGDQARADHTQAEGTLTHMQQATSARLTEAQEEWDQERQALTTAHQVSQQQLIAAHQVSQQRLTEAQEEWDQERQALTAAHQVSQQQLTAAHQVSQQRLTEAHQVSQQQLTEAQEEWDQERQALTAAHQVSQQQLTEAQEEWDQERQELTAAHQVSQQQLTAKIQELEVKIEQKSNFIQTQSEQLESSLQMVQCLQRDNEEMQGELETELSLKTAALQEERGRHQACRQQLQRLESKVCSMEESLSAVQGHHKDSEKELMGSLQSLSFAAAAREAELDMTVSACQQQITALKQQVEERDSLLRQKEKALLEREERDSLLRQKEQQVEERDSLLRQKEQQVEERDSLLRQKEQQVEERDSLLRQKEQQVEERDSLLRQKEQQVEERDSLLRQKEQQVEERDSLLRQKEKALLEREQQHKAELEAFQISAASEEEELRNKLSSQAEELSALVQRQEGQERAMSRKQDLLEEVEREYARQLDAVRQASTHTEQELRDTAQRLQHQLVEISNSLQAKDLALTRTQAALSADRHRDREGQSSESEWTTCDSDSAESQSDAPVRTQASGSVGESDVCVAVRRLIAAVEKRSVAQLRAALSQLQSAPAPSVVRLAHCLHTLLQQTEAAELAARQREKELLVRLKESESHTTQLQTTVTRLSEESRHRHIASEDKDTTEMLREREATIHDLLARLEQQKERGGRKVKETEYWKDQFRSLQEDMEKEMRQQRLLFENEVAEQRAEYDTRLASALEEQEGEMVGQRALLEDRVTGLQDDLASTRQELAATQAELTSIQAELTSTHEELASTQAELASTQAELTSTQAELSSTREELASTLAELGSTGEELASTLTDREAEFRLQLTTQRTEAEQRVSSLTQRLERALAQREEEGVEREAEREVEREAERDRQLEELNTCLQSEVQTHRAMRSQMEHDRLKIQHLETELAERCRELEELLQSEQEEREEVVGRVVQESQQELGALQQAREEERQHSLHQISHLQAETGGIKEELAVSVQRTEVLQTQLTELEQQKNDAVRLLEHEVHRQISMVRQAEHHNTQLQAKITDLEGVMTQHKVELARLREHQRREQVRAQAPCRDRVTQLTGEITVITAQYHALMEENKALQEKAAETTKVMGEQLKRHERQCQLSEAQHSLMEDRLTAFADREAQWTADSHKMQELLQRLQKLESGYGKDATPGCLSPTESKTSSTDSASTSRYDLRSKTQMDLDGSFTNTLPATPGAAERQMAALRDLDSVSGRSGRPSTASSGRYSLCSTGSAKSVVFVPVGAGKLFACEDEPESPKFEWGRLNDLQRRTTLCAPPLRASPLDTQTVKGWQVDSHTLPHATVIGKGDKPGNPTSTPTPGSTGSRKRRPEAMDVDEEPTARRGASEAQTRKLARHGPIYQKPGPPTPLTDRHRKLSDPHLNSAAARKKACTPRKSPRVSPRRSPRVRARLRRFADENVMPQDAGRGSVSLEAGVSPSKTLSSSGRSLTRQKAFLSKSRLPLMARPGDYGDTPSPSPPTVAGSAAKAKSPTSSRHQPAQAKGRRQPLAVRNCLHTQL